MKLILRKWLKCENVKKGYKLSIIFFFSKLLFLGTIVLLPGFLDTGLFWRPTFSIVGLNEQNQASLNSFPFFLVILFLSSPRSSLSSIQNPNSLERETKTSIYSGGDQHEAKSTAKFGPFLLLVLFAGNFIPFFSPNWFGFVMLHGNYCWNCILNYFVLCTCFNYLPFLPVFDGLT